MKSLEIFVNNLKPEYFDFSGRKSHFYYVSDYRVCPVFTDIFTKLSGAADNGLFVGKKNLCVINALNIWCPVGTQCVMKDK